MKGTKHCGLEMSEVLRSPAPPWGEVTGVIDEYLGNHFRPQYSVMVDPRWRHFFEYQGISLTHDDIYAAGENPNINYLDEELFEL